MSSTSSSNSSFISPKKRKRPWNTKNNTNPQHLSPQIPKRQKINPPSIDQMSITKYNPPPLTSISKIPKKIIKQTHVSITFANINNTLDVITLEKYNVCAMNANVVLANKGKLMIKTSEPLQTDLEFQFSTNATTKIKDIGIRIINTTDLESIHSRNTFRMGTCLFYCQDEKRFIWAFPLRNTRRVACQHFCCACDPPRIVTRSVGITSKKCNKRHSLNTPCIYAVCNGKPPKCSIPKSYFNKYQYYEHGINNNFIILCKPMPAMEYANNNDGKKRRTIKNDNYLLPFQQNININYFGLKEIQKQKQKRIQWIKNRNMKKKLKQKKLQNKKKVEPKIEELEKITENKIIKNEINTNKIISSNILFDEIPECQQLLFDGKFDHVIDIITNLLSISTPTLSSITNKNNDELMLRLLLSNAYFYSKTHCVTDAMHEIDIILSCIKIEMNVNLKIILFETRKLQGIINGQLRNYKCSCNDLLFIIMNNPYGSGDEDTGVSSYNNNQWMNELYIKYGKECNSDLQNVMKSSPDSSSASLTISTNVPLVNKKDLPSIYYVKSKVPPMINFNLKGDVSNDNMLESVVNDYDGNMLQSNSSFGEQYFFGDNNSEHFIGQLSVAQSVVVGDGQFIEEEIIHSNRIDDAKVDDVKVEQSKVEDDGNINMGNLRNEPLPLIEQQSSIPMLMEEVRSDHQQLIRDTSCL